ncbi:hypothetical protein M8998_05785 [Sphingobacterium sp. lm-10]|uniref:hypothetical protein n=1 Tax=Sphingobacterium sp. lm-10 TaxID=2944904 RepID=UPI002020192F|nr:hypothetical protein [Sphingobacterium sp. lm-10]MCL7987447.1 hypothetical protein [Sphingobacterium sp. lm-10]
MNYLKQIKIIVALFILSVLFLLSCANSSENVAKAESPRIINIVNFIRQTDYRVEGADSLLLDATTRQVALLKKHKLPGTFLLQYDALINPKYQDLLLNGLDDQSEIGAWWEITQPHCEAADIPWRGEHRWVSTANIAFTTGYTPEEREKLTDVYMEKFKGIFGYYPKSVGSWFIDSHSLNYMYEKYQIVVSTNCKDQVGTDGYTLWGGYWNQAYYPSKGNAYMPAQTKENQIPVPIFRMLGSDPIYQYDMGVGTGYQGVITLEPVYEDGGMDKRWTDYFLNAIVEQPSLAFNYGQAGQENSFTWDGMKKGLEMQIPIFDSLRREGKIRVETLAESGKWFKDNFELTPATAVTALEDYRDEGNKSIWYNSRFYRTNLSWHGKNFRFRDIHLFDERVESAYLRAPGKGGQFLYFTLPVVDGYFWSTEDELAGLRLMTENANGEETALLMDTPEVTETAKDVLQIKSRDQFQNAFTITLYPDHIDVACQPAKNNFSWYLALQIPVKRQPELPFNTIEKTSIAASFKGYSYTIELENGHFQRNRIDGQVFQLLPENHVIRLITKY